MDSPFVSIVIPVKERNPYLDESVRHCLALDYPGFEIMVLPDEGPENGLPEIYSHPLLRLVPTGPAGPSEKRDMALAFCHGQIIAFLDDDAFPETGWLRNAVRYFADEAVAAVGGPAVTPPGDGPLRRASGLVYSSLLCGGSLAYRYTPQKSREVDDYPTCNLLVRKAVLEKLGGFNTEFWPGEDTKLCLEITKNLGQKIIYAPDALVYHHRRPLFGPHLRQVRSYATHRGYFVKRFPATSFRFTYFLPSLFVAGLTLGLMAALLSGLGAGKLRLAPAVAVGIVLTHLTYGIWFVYGLLSPKLAEEQRHP
jgi:cellulose synthase/poly-beta-1,6-N-acetylglucosamine synthase-like glycosyltransferase